MKQTKAKPAEHPLRAVRRAGVPLVSFETADPAQTIKGCIKALNGKAGEIPLVQWDIGNGLVAMNPTGKAAIQWYDPLTMMLPDILKGFANNPAPGTVVFFHNLQNFITRDGVAQGLWNLRDVFKSGSVKGTAICVGPALKLPPELASDVVPVVEPAPNREAIGAVLDSVFSDAAKAGGDHSKVDREPVVSALLGLQSEFDVEQTLSLEISRDSVDVGGLWKRKIARLKVTAGAEITIDNPTFADYVGGDNVRGEALAFINGRKRPGVVFYIDEVEKKFAGAGSDTSGVSTELVGMFLSWCQDNGVRGILLPGVSGSGKTWFAKCAAGEAAVPMVSMGEVKGQFVGQSNQQFKALLDTVKTMAGDGSILLLASCNWIQALTPDVLSRFNLGQFFVDFPGEAELQALVRMYSAKYELPEQPMPDMSGWVGREVENACYKAWHYNRPLVETARNVLPTAISQKAKWDDLRRTCSGRFLSASKPGFYEYKTIKVASNTGRGLSFA